MPDGKVTYRKTPVLANSRRPSVEGRASLLSCGILSPRNPNTIVDLKADSVNVCSLENISHAKPEPVKFGRFSRGYHGADKSYRGESRTTRRDSVLSNTSIVDGISEMPTQNTLIARSTNLYPHDLKIKVPGRKESLEDVRSSKSSSIFNSRTRRLSTRKLVIPSKQTLESNADSLKEVGSNTSLDQNMTWQFLTTGEISQKPSQTVQQPATSRVQSHRGCKKRQNIPKVACNKVRSLQTCLVPEPTSRKNSLTVREQQLNTFRKTPKTPLNVLNLLQKIHCKDSAKEIQQRRQSRDSIQNSKLFGRPIAHSLNKTINESFENKVDGSVVEETKSILNK